MSDKKLALLGIIAVLVTAAAIVQHNMTRRQQTSDFSGSVLIEGLAVDTIAAIEVSGESGSQTVRLTRLNGRFVLPEKDNYPADVTKINTLINNCLDIRTIEKITDNPENHADLKVTPDTARYVISFMDDQQSPIVTLILSETHPESNIAYVRLQSEDTVYSIQSAPWFNTRHADYMNTELLNVSKDQINSVAVKTPEDSYVLTSAKDSDTIRLEKMPEGKQFSGTTYQTIFGALSSLRFEDVSEAASFSGNFDITYNCKLHDLTVYKLSVAQVDDKAYVKVTADYLDKTPVEKTMGQVESDEELEKKEAKLLAVDAVKEFNARHEGWVYQIPSHKAELLTKPLSELIEDIPQPEPEPQPAETNPAES